MAKPSRLALVLGFLAVYLIWGSTYLAIRFTLETFPPFLMAAVRFALAGGILYAWARFKGEKAPELPHWRPALIIGGLLLLVGNGGVVWAEQRVASGLAALLVATEPLWIVLMQAVGPDRVKPTPRILTGVFVGLVGLVLLVAPWEAAGSRVDLWGAFAVILGAFSWAGGSLYSRRVHVPRSPFMVTSMQMLAGSAWLGLASLVTKEPARFDVSLISAKSVLSLLYLMVFGSLVAYTVYVWLIRVANPSVVSTYAYVNPVVAVLLGFFLAGEPISTRMLAAAAVIVSAVVLITLPDRAAAELVRAGARRFTGKRSDGKEPEAMERASC